MGKKELTENEQMVLSYLVLVEEYVKQNKDSDDCDKKSLYDQFTQIFDTMGENGETAQQRVFYDGLVGLSKKEYIVFEDASCIGESDNDTVYRFDSLTICTKGTDYVQKYMKLDNGKLEITDRKIPKLNFGDLENMFKKINENEIFKFVAAILP